MHSIKPGVWAALALLIVPVLAFAGRAENDSSGGYRYYDASGASAGRADSNGSGGYRYYHSDGSSAGRAESDGSGGYRYYDASGAPSSGPPFR